jgi:hypothetical protein
MAHDQYLEKNGVYFHIIDLVKDCGLSLESRLIFNP